MKPLQITICLIILCAANGKLSAQRSYLDQKQEEGDTCNPCGQQMQGYTIDYLWNYYCVHRDSLVFTVPYSRISFGSHGYYKRATRFAIHLPTHLQETFLESGKYYTFNFPDYENFLITMNNYSKGPQKDSSCIPDADYIDNVVRPNDFFNNIDASPIPNRINQVFFRNGQMILLLNIKQENYPRFLEAVNSFRIIDHGDWTMIKGKEQE